MQNLTDEIKDLLLTRSLLLQRVSNSLTKDIINAYVSVIDDILAQIATGKNINLVNMNKIINELNAKLTPDLTSVNDDLVQLGISEASYVASGINGAIGIDIVSKLPTDRTVQKIVNTSLMDGLTINEWLGKQDKSFQETLTKQIRLGVIEGETNPQIVSRLKGALDIKNNNNIKTIVRTAVATVTNQVRMETYKENSDVFKGYEHNSTLDARVSLICSTRDGATYDLEYKGLNAKGKVYPFKQVPLHFNCRSIILPITKSFKELGIPLDEVPIGTRSSMDGYVSRDTTFEKWFEGKPKAFQEEYLGKGRYELYKKGTISFSDLVNQNGRTLKISELTKINPIAKVSNIPTIDFGYDGKFNKYVADIRDEAKIVIDKLPKPKEIGITKVGASYYEPYKNKLMVEDSKVYFNHEYGHHIDTMIGKKTDNLFYSQSESVKKAMQEDIKSLGLDTTKGKQNIVKYLEENHYNKTEARGKIYYDAKNDYSNVVSDIFDSMSKGYINGKGFAGHGKNYFKEDIYRHLENNGNMFALWSDNGKEWEQLKTIIPNMAKEFEKTMNEVINGKFD